MYGLKGGLNSKSEGEKQGVTAGQFAALALLPICVWRASCPSVSSEKANSELVTKCRRSSCSAEVQIRSQCSCSGVFAMSIFSLIVLQRHTEELEK